MKTILDYYEYQAKTDAPGCWHGPCPWCGGKDRFAILLNEAPERGGRYVCRKCGATGDGVDYLQQLHRMSIRDAKDAIGAIFSRSTTTSSTSFPSRQKDRPGGERKAGIRDKGVKLLRIPDAAWQDAAETLVADCADRIQASKDAHAELARRGITMETAVASGLGWNDADRYELRSSFGLDAWTDADGRMHDKLFVPSGLVLPIWCDEHVVSVGIRRSRPPEPSRRFHQLAGGADAAVVLYPRHDLQTVCLVTESYLDAVLCCQEGIDALTCVALTGTGKMPDVAVMQMLDEAPAVLLAFDDDDTGRQATEAWLEYVGRDPRYVIWTPRGAKDPCDMAAAFGADAVARWLFDGLIEVGKRQSNTIMPMSA